MKCSHRVSRCEALIRADVPLCPRLPPGPRMHSLKWASAQWGFFRAHIWHCNAANEPEMLDIIKPRLGVCHTLPELMRPSVGANKHLSVKRCYFTCRWRHKCRHQLLYLQSGVEQKCQTKTGSVFLVFRCQPLRNQTAWASFQDAAFCTHIRHVGK